MNRFLVATLVAASVSPAAAEPKHKLRIATVAPEGTSWANTFTKFSIDVEKETGGDVAVKFYFGGIAGSEEEVLALLTAGKLDGAISGGPLCRKAAPSMRVLDVIGLFQKQEEAMYVLGELRPTLDAEAHKAGYTILTTGSLGPLITFSREPITSMADLQKTRLWTWNLNDVFVTEGTHLKIPIVSTPLADAQRSYDEKRSDGFVTTPVSALAFQWYVGTKYITDLRMGYLMGCFVMREAALDALAPEHQALVRKAASRVGIKIDADNRRMDEKLLGNMFEKSGLKFSPVSAKFRAEFFDAARVAKKQIAEALVPHELLDKVGQLLADYRAEHQ